MENIIIISIHSDCTWLFTSMTAFTSGWPENSILPNPMCYQPECLVKLGFSGISMVSIIFHSCQSLPTDEPRFFNSPRIFVPDACWIGTWLRMKPSSTPGRSARACSSLVVVRFGLMSSAHQGDLTALDTWGIFLWGVKMKWNYRNIYNVGPLSYKLVDKPQ